MQYQVKLDIFEGPLDLLLYLIKKNEVDIYDIPIALITGQYIEYLDLMRELNLDVAGEFLVMASTLIKIKSQTLLPPVEGEGEGEDEADPRAELMEHLLEYQRYKDAAHQLVTRELLEKDIFTRPQIDEPGENKGEEDVLIEASFQSLFDPLVTRYEIVVAFLAVLELIRLRAIRVFQIQPYGEMRIVVMAGEVPLDDISS